MRKLAVLTFMTLDGVMQAPVQEDEDTSGEFNYGSWSIDYFEEVMMQVNEEIMIQPIDFLFGRKTYQSFAGHFPNIDNEPLANKFNNATKYVATSTLKKLDWRNSFSLTGDIVAEISSLKSQNGPLLQVHGSWQLIQTLLAHKLVDEFRLWIFPVIVGSGKRLFDQSVGLTNLTLVKTKTTSKGVVMCLYKTKQ